MSGDGVDVGHVIHWCNFLYTTTCFVGLCLVFSLEDDNHHENDKSQDRMNSEEGNIDFNKASQKHHGDGGHLFDHAHLPPHCINVFYP